MCRRFFSTVLIILGIVASEGMAQQVTLGTPFYGFGNGFFEHFGIGFGFEHVTPNSMMFFQSGTGMGANPVFGGFDPSAASTFGIGGRNGNFNWNLNVTASQGYSQSNVSTTPSLTLPNGGFGFFNSTVQRPFVFSFMPIVNSDPVVFRQAKLQQYETAAQQYAIERQERETQELAELEALARESQRNIKQAKPKQDDPPLVLGKRKSYGSRAID